MKKDLEVLLISQFLSFQCFIRYFRVEQGGGNLRAHCRESTQPWLRGGFTLPCGTSEHPRVPRAFSSGSRALLESHPWRNLKAV